MPTEEEIRQWVRDERAQIKREEQEACRHLKSGTLHKDGLITCDQCAKVLQQKRETDAYSRVPLPH